MLYPDRIFTKVTTNFLQNNLNPDDIYSDTKRLSRFYYERHIRYKTYLAQFIGQFALGKTGMNTMLVNMLEDFSSMKKF